MWNNIIQGYNQLELHLQSITIDVLYAMALCQLHRKWPIKENSAHQLNAMERGSDVYGNTRRTYTCLDFNMRQTAIVPTVVRFSKRHYFQKKYDLFCLEFSN